MTSIVKLLRTALAGEDDVGNSIDRGRVPASKGIGGRFGRGLLFTEETLRKAFRGGGRGTPVCPPRPSWGGRIFYRGKPLLGEAATERAHTGSKGGWRSSLSTDHNGLSGEGFLFPRGDG